jgi:hypothetical protein
LTVCAEIVSTKQKKYYFCAPDKWQCSCYVIDPGQTILLRQSYEGRREKWQCGYPTTIGSSGLEIIEEV